jgi:hypothetical protein
VDRHRFDAGPDPDPTFYFDADTHPGPDATPNLSDVGKSDYFNFFVLVYIVLSFSSVS